MSILFTWFMKVSFPFKPRTTMVIFFKKMYLCFDWWAAFVPVDLSRDQKLWERAHDEDNGLWTSDDEVRLTRMRTVSIFFVWEDYFFPGMKDLSHRTVTLPLLRHHSESGSVRITRSDMSFLSPVHIRHLSDTTSCSTDHNFTFFSLTRDVI